MLLRLLPIFILLILQIRCQSSSELVEEVRKCVQDNDFGNKTLVCDPHGRLANTTTEKLQMLLGGLNQKIACTCPNGCRRADGTNGYIGLIHVSNSFATKNLSSDMGEIFRERGLGNSSCNHGLLLTYMKDTQKLASYRGGRSFVQLTDEDMIKLHEIARKGEMGDDATALQFLLNNYKEIAESPVQRAESWTPVIGLIAAILLVLIALAILLSLFLARFCCCWAKRRNKEVYHVTPAPTYKPVDPIYVVTPPGDRFGPHSDALYSTPYSGSPLPLPYPPPPGARPITPGSANAHNRILRTRPSALSGSAGSESPKSSRVAPKTRRGERSPIEDEPDYAAVPHGDGYGSMMRDVDQREMYSSLPRGSLPRGGLPHHGFIPPPLHPFMIPPPLSPQSEGSSLRAFSIPPSGSIPPQGGDLQFLDPKRKMETQTREEMIY